MSVGKDAPREPTAQECSAQARIPAPHWVPDGWIVMALWYPQMGGYVARCVIVAPPGLHEDGKAGCFDAYVWHDGEWPFHNGENPREMHHCDAQQFIEFGQIVDEAMRQGAESGGGS